MKITHSETKPYKEVIIDMADMRDGERGEVQPNKQNWAIGEVWICIGNMFKDVKQVDDPYISRVILDCRSNREMCKVKVRRRA